MAYVAALGVYASEGRKRNGTVSVGNQSDANRIDVRAGLRAFDAVKEEATLRLEFEPRGAFSAEDGFATAFDMRILVNASSGRQEYEFIKNKRINPIEFSVNTGGGDVSRYPFDQYQATFEILITASREDIADAESEAGDTTPDEPGPAVVETVTRVPVDTYAEFDPYLAGWSVAGQAGNVAIPGYTAFTADFARTATAIYFACFIVGATFLIGLGILAIALAVSVRGRQVELPMISLGVIVLFALPALRNFLPGQPPIGMLLDFLAFFWAQAIVAISVLILTVTWLVRENGYPRRWGGKPYPPEDVPENS